MRKKATRLEVQIHQALCEYVEIWEKMKKEEARIREEKENKIKKMKEYIYSFLYFLGALFIILVLVLGTGYLLILFSITVNRSIS